MNAWARAAGAARTTAAAAAAAINFEFMSIILPRDWPGKWTDRGPGSTHPIGQQGCGKQAFATATEANAGARFALAPVRFPKYSRVAKPARERPPLSGERHNACQSRRRIILGSSYPALQRQPQSRTRKTVHDRRQRREGLMGR